MVECVNCGNGVCLCDRRTKLKAELAANRPPLGLTPRWIRAEQRQEEIREAVRRLTPDEGIPAEWLEEYNEIEAYLRKRREAKKPVYPRVKDGNFSFAVLYIPNGERLEAVKKRFNVYPYVFQIITKEEFDRATN